MFVKRSLNDDLGRSQAATSYNRKREKRPHVGARYARPAENYPGLMLFFAGAMIVACMGAELLLTAAGR